MKAPSVFHQSRPVLITSLVNKSGSIGLSLLPMLLVTGHYSTAQSSFAMSVVKGSTIVAILVSGWSSDFFGLRRTVLVSFLFAAFGLAFLPVHLGFPMLLISGVVAQFGIASINSALRLLLTKTVERRHQKEALGWMRSTNNLGQVLSFGLASITATLGATLLIWFDSLTSFLAFLIGFKLLPRHAQCEPAVDELKSGSAKTSRRIWPFIGCAVLMTGWNFIYEFFMDGIAGRLKVINPDDGLRIFSLMMVMNTILCTALAVVASRFLNRVVLSLGIGVVLNTAGIILAVYQTASVTLLSVGVLFLTLGEVIYGALGQFLLIRAVPASRRENSVYSGAILVANFGKIAGAGLAFPLVVNASQPSAAVLPAAIVALVSFTVLVLGRRQFTELGKS